MLDMDGVDGVDYYGRSYERVHKKNHELINSVWIRYFIRDKMFKVVVIRIDALGHFKRG